MENSFDAAETGLFLFESGCKKTCEEFEKPEKHVFTV